MAIDGDFDTRWSSAFTDNEYIALDFGSPVFVDSIRVFFEHASSAEYTIQVSDTGRLWNVVYTEDSGPMGHVVADIAGLNVTTRYLRLSSTARNTPYGISIYEFQAFGSSDDCTLPPQHLTSVQSGKALDVADFSQENGGNIHQWDYVGGDNQRWEFVPLGSEVYQLRAVGSGKCLDIDGPSMDNGANIHQWDCHTGTSQWWHLQQVNPGEYQVRNHQTAKCLDVAEFSQENGGTIHQWACAGSPNQLWTIGTD
jgi:hypothetical protein